MRKAAKTVAKQAGKAALGSARAIAAQDPTTKALFNYVEKRVRNRIRNRKRRNKQNNNDYSKVPIQAPISMAIAASGVTPMVTTRGETKIMTGQELIEPTVYSYNSGWSYDIDGVLINPLEPVFPLLAGEATNYQLYRFTKLKVQYENICASTSTGQLYLGCLTDPSDDVPSSAIEATAIKNSVRGPVWAPLEFDLPCDGMFRYINGTITSDADMRNIFQFRFWYGLQNAALAIPFGSIRMTYEIELAKRISGTDPSQVSVDFSVANGEGVITPFDIKFADALKSNRGPKWFKYDTTNHTLKFLAPGKYTSTLMIAADNDIDIGTIMAGLALTDPQGNPVTYTIITLRDSATVGYTNNNVSYMRIKYTVPKGTTLSFFDIVTSSYTTITLSLTAERV